MLVVLLAISTVAYGQKRGDKTLLKTEVMAEKLGLDAKQKAALDRQLKEANVERKAQIEKLKGLREEMKRDAFVARQAREAQLKEILTDEQWATYQKLRSEGKKKAVMKRRRMGKGNSKNGAALRGKRFKEGKKKGTDGGGDE